MASIGVLALQGSVAEHMKVLSAFENVSAYEVKTKEQLADVSGLIIPGGESTTIGKLLKEYHLVQPLTDIAQKGLPIWGTCAGMILMAKEIIGEENVHLGIMDIAVKRNAYGSQLNSFSINAPITSIAEHDIPLIFIRAPWVEEVWADTEILSIVEEKIVAVRQGNLFATSFHPELTSDLTVHTYFLDIVNKWENLQR